MTNEEIYMLLLNCNGLFFNICINKADLLGEPQVGRRLKELFGCREKSDF